MTRRSEIEKRGKRIAESGGVEKISDTEWRVQSESLPDTKYDVIRGEKGWTCPCPYFVGNQTWCKHIAAVQLIRSGKVAPGGRRMTDTESRAEQLQRLVLAGGDQAEAAEILLRMLTADFNVGKSLAKSALQKAIRLRQRNSAVRCALMLAAHSFNDLARRLPIILVEDVLICPWYADLIEVMIRARQKDYVPDMTDLVLLLETAARACDVEHRDLIKDAEYSWSPGFRDEDARVLGSDSEALLSALVTRKKHGGMKSDQQMLIGCANLWYSRFSGDEVAWWSRLDEMWHEPSTLPIGVLEKGDIPITAVDMHCSPILGILEKKKEVESAVKRVYGDDPRSLHDVLDAAMWYAWSSINDRVDLREGRVFSYSDQAGPVEKRKAEALFDVIGDEARSIAKWWIRKQATG